MATFCSLSCDWGPERATVPALCFRRARKLLRALQHFIGLHASQQPKSGDPYSTLVACVYLNILKIKKALQRFIGLHIRKRNETTGNQ